MVAVIGRIESAVSAAAIADVKQVLAKLGLLERRRRLYARRPLPAAADCFWRLAQPFVAALIAELVLLLFLYERFWPPIIILGCSLLSTTAVFTRPLALRRRSQHHGFDGHDNGDRHQHRDGDFLCLRICRAGACHAAAASLARGEPQPEGCARSPDDVTLAALLTFVAARPGDRAGARRSSSRSPSRSFQACCYNSRWFY